MDSCKPAAIQTILVKTRGMKNKAKGINVGIYMLNVEDRWVKVVKDKNMRVESKQNILYIHIKLLKMKFD